MRMLIWVSASSRVVAGKGSADISRLPIRASMCVTGSTRDFTRHNENESPIRQKGCHNDVLYVIYVSLRIEERGL